jgi:transposase
VAKNKGYPSDLTDAQWELIEPLVPTPQGGWPFADAFAAPDRGLGP